MELKDFYRQLRPEYFSDSTIESESILPRETLEFHLSQISTNQKQDEFETLVRRLLERFVCPNLIPQVGPTGGGDGKTDTETHSISTFISDRWFIPENGWDKDEKWAFAISSKEDWASKIKIDIKSVLSTGRDYTKLFFITNQKPSSKKKKDLQDKFKIEQNIDVEIFDREWLLEKIYGNNAINIVIDSLNLSESYKQKVKVGPRDSERLESLKKLEDQISSPNRYFEYDFQLVDDALEAAILSRMLEKPKEEVLGKFDRAIRFCEKLNSNKLRVKIHYQRAWTYVHWYDDLDSFIEDYKKVKSLIGNDSAIQEIEWLNNLFTILHTQLKIKTQYSSGINIEEESAFISQMLNRVSNEKFKPSSALMAQTMIIFNKITDFLPVEDGVPIINELFISIKKLFEKAENHLDYPFETYSKMVKFYGDLFPDNTQYDLLIDATAEISARRNSEISSAHIYFQRGVQKYKNGLYKESLIYFGKSIFKFAKEETEEGLYLALRGLSESYEKMGLPFAAYCSQVAATHIAFKEWFVQRRINERIFNCVCRLANMELINGRIPQLLTWRELLDVLAKQLNLPQEEYLEKVAFLDPLLAVKLINSDPQINGYASLPEILSREELEISSCASLYKLGYVEKSVEPIKDTPLLLDYENPVDFFKKLSTQPAANQISSKLELCYSNNIQLQIKILGCNITCNVYNDKDTIIKLESLLAYIESFFATSWEQIIPSVSDITLNIITNNDINHISLKQPDEDRPILDIEISPTSFTEDNAISEYVEICAYLFRFFMGHNVESYIENLYKEEEFHQRISLLYQHYSFVRGILGDNPKILLRDWMKDDDTTYPFVENWNDGLSDTLEGADISEEKNFNHSNVSVLSIINISLWNKAKWMGFALMSNYAFSELNIILAFENIGSGKKIFEEWIEKVGNDDKQNKIKIAVIQGINNEHPYWYRVHIYSEPSFDDLKGISNRHFITSSRMHTMMPDSPRNLEGIKSLFKRLGEYRLCPVEISMSDQTIVQPIYLDLAIKKYNLEFINAWEVGVNSIHRAAIFDDDIPIIPIGIDKPPIVELMRVMATTK